MKAEIYQTGYRILATFYILFTAVLQLMPDKKYETIHPVFYGTSAYLYAVYTAFFVPAGKPGDDRGFFAALQ